MRAFASVTKSEFVFQSYFNTVALRRSLALPTRSASATLELYPQPAVLQFRVCTDVLVCPHSRVSRSP